MKQLRHNQEGLASILIVTIIISVVSLITIGFATVIRREQRQALDQQIAAQARYAAESALNDVIAKYRADPSSLTNTTECDASQEQTFTDTEDIQTTCVLIDMAPGPLEYDQVSLSESTLIWLDPGATPVERLVITWENPGVGASHSCLPSDYTLLPPHLNWDGNGDTDRMGMVRFDLSQVGTAGSTFSRDSLRSRMFGGVLYPKTGSGQRPSVDLSYTGQPVVFGGCTADGVPADTFTDGVDPYAAYAIINMPKLPDGSLDQAFQNSRYIMRIRSLYRTSKVRIVGYDEVDRVVQFADTQIALEATARVGDITQRVQVRLPAGTPPRELIPDDAIHVAGQGVCKLLETEPLNGTASNCNNLSFVPPAP